MKKFLAIFITLTIGLTNIVEADTIDFWHVYYNDVEIKGFEGTLKIKDIKETDSLTVIYFSDAYYGNCEAKMEIEDSNKFVIVERFMTKEGFHAPSIKISIFDLLVNARQSPFFAYYNACMYKNRPKILLFKINFE